MRHSLFIKLILVFILILPVIPGHSQTDIAAGDVSGTWLLADSPFHVNGNITIPDGETLIIEPGVEVIFTGQYNLDIKGRLLAEGNKQDSIRFTAQNAGTGWNGIDFINTPAANDSSKLVYCQLTSANALGTFPLNCGGAILSSGVSKILISNCLIDNNYAGYVGGGICLGYGASPEIRNNIISNNFAPWGGGIGIVNNCNPLIMNNIIIHNKCNELGGGVQINQTSNPVLINNTIAFNRAGQGGGIDCRDNSDPSIINTILFGNTASDGNQVCLYVTNCDPDFYNCCIDGGLDDFGGPGSGENFTGVYENNLDCNPRFMDAAADDYHLSALSSCIGAGADSIQIGDLWYYPPSTDFEGSPRSCPAGSAPDIGALENASGNPVTEVLSTQYQIPLSCRLMQNHPNPFNPVTSINYELPADNHVIISVYNSSGREVQRLVNEQQKAGHYTLYWDASEQTSGLYILHVSVGSFRKSIKMILMK